MSIRRRVSKKVDKSIFGYQMIQPGDRVLIGLSGGKDSATLAHQLAMKARAFSIPFSVEAVHIHTEYADEHALDRIRDLAESVALPLHVVPVSVTARLKPGRRMNCYWCSTQRRTELLRLAEERGFDRIALGHHMDDILETFLMNLTRTGELSTMLPAMRYDRYPQWIIRPLAWVTETETAAYADSIGFEPVRCRCGYDRTSSRLTARSLLEEMVRAEGARVRERMMRALHTARARYMPTYADSPDPPVRIAPGTRFPRYWEIDERPTLLLGGSVEDNVFQIPNLSEHLRLLASVGGNYIRCTMSSRDPGNVRPFGQTDDGRYDLTKPSAEYWRRFDRCATLAGELGIIMQVEVWDRFDFSREPWHANPFNPRNNINYTAAEVGMEVDYPEHPGKNLQPFFFSVPELNNNTLLLRYQQRFVDTLVEHAEPHRHILFCMDNETAAAEAWGAYWARYVRATALQRGSVVYVTEMWDQWEVTGEMHRRTIDHPERYQYLELSQNNQVEGRANWDNLHQVWTGISSRPRPINNVKIYGAEAKIHKDRTHAEQSFWRTVFGGAAAARFHRPPIGIGLDPGAQAHIRAMRMVEAAFGRWCAGAPAMELIGDPAGNVAYCFARPPEAAAVVFLSDVELGFDLSRMAAPVHVRWLDARVARWIQDPPPAGDRAALRLRPPREGIWVAVVTAA